MSEDCGERSASGPDKAESPGEQWLQENRAWIERYNAEVDAYGVWSDGKRCF